MPIRVPDSLPALDDLAAEGVDLIASGQALKQDIRPLRLLLLNLMPTKKVTEIQFARLFGCSPLQVELILMTTESYTPKNTEPAYLRRFYRQLSDVENDYFDALIITGAPIETIPFEESLFVNQNSKYILSILNEDVKSSSWLLTNGIHKIGRLDDKEIILDDVTVSRNHGYISVDDNELTITDEDSTNGIFVNGELTKESNLTSGTRIQIGKFFLIVSSVDKK